MNNPVHIFSRRAQFVYLSAVGANVCYVWGDNKINGLTKLYRDPFPHPLASPSMSVSFLFSLQPVAQCCAPALHALLLTGHVFSGILLQDSTIYHPKGKSCH